jgi:signal transduction histidine kinase
MTGLAVTSIALAALWLVVGLLVATRNRGRGRVLLACCLALAATHAVAAAWPAAAPLVLGAWLAYALVLPSGDPGPAGRRTLIGLAIGGSIGWTVVLAAGHHTANVPGFVVAAAVVALCGAAANALRYRRVTADERRTLQWLAASCVIATAAAVVSLWLHAMTARPAGLIVPVAWCLVIIPVAHGLALLVRDARAARVALVESIVAAGVALLVAVAYLVVVVGIDGSLHGHERSVFVSSLVAAIVVALLVLPVRQRFRRVAEQLVGVGEGSPTEVVTSFGARMSRAVPMDELMLQLVESLRSGMADGGAEIWTGAEGTLTRTVSVPTRPADRLMLGERERVVVGRARVGGPAWTAVWLPQLLAQSGEPAGDHRVVPIAHLGELLGLLVVRRTPDAGQFTDDEDTALVDLARQLGLALHNVRLDSALQASLAELAERNEELQASRQRIVAAADSSRRAIERNLHDGAQQHLVALAVKLGLTRQVAEAGETDTVMSLLEDLRGDVQTTIGELRELAHGIYPPLLRDRGLSEALRAASVRMAMPCSVTVDLPGRYPEDAETAAYFCCLEAMQNAGKYAGDGASVVVEVTGDAETLRFELRDDGAGFDTATTQLGHGFTNMTDRLGAIGGSLVIESTPGAGTTVRASIPAQPIEPDAPANSPRTAIRSTV